MRLNHTTPKGFCRTRLRHLNCVETLKQLSKLKNLLGDHSDLDPPDSMPNSEVKQISADGSVGFPHVRVGHRQALILRNPASAGFFAF